MSLEDKNRARAEKAEQLELAGKHALVELRKNRRDPKALVSDLVQQGLDEKVAKRVVDDAARTVWTHAAAKLLRSGASHEAVVADLVARGASEGRARQLLSDAEETRPSRVRGAIFIAIGFACLLAAWGVVAYYDSQWAEAQERANREHVTLVVQYNPKAIAARCALCVVGAIFAFVKGIGIFAAARDFVKKPGEPTPGDAG